VNFLSGHTMNFLLNCVSIISQDFCHHVSNSVVPNVSQLVRQRKHRRYIDLHFNCFSPFGTRQSLMITKPLSCWFIFTVENSVFSFMKDF
ncbi:hypothetical protein L9F63_019978, partial [Diploptera punctata]